MKYLIYLNISLIAILGILVSWKHEIVYVYEPEVIQAEVSAYSEIDSCHYENCIMANGKPAKVGYIACPRYLPLGAIVELLGASYECGDRTAKWVDGRFDVFIGYGKESHRKALNFGIKTIEVTVLNNL